MLKQFYKLINHYKSYLIGGAAVTALSFLVGFILMWFLMITDEECTKFAELGSMFTLISMVLFSGFYCDSYFADKRMALSMGQTRKAFLTEQAVRNLVLILLTGAIVWILQSVELGLVKWQNPGLEGIAIFVPLDNLLIVLVCFAVLAMLFGELSCHLGRWAEVAVTLSGLLILKAVTSMMIDTVPKEGGSAANVFRYLGANTSVSAPLWVALYAAILTAIMAAVILLNRKSSVNN